MDIGGKYNWINQPERLVYLGNNWSGNGYWHQFAKVESPKEIWCECLDSDLSGIQATKNAPAPEGFGGQPLIYSSTVLTEY